MGDSFPGGVISTLQEASDLDEPLKEGDRVSLLYQVSEG